MLLGTGAGLYFALPFEPPLWGGGIAMAAGLAAAALAFRRPWPLALVAALLIGFGMAKLREAAVVTAVLDHPVVAHLTGRVMAMEPRPTGVRLVLDEVRSGALDPAPRRVRVALRGDPGFRPGQWLSAALGSKHTLKSSAFFGGAGVFVRNGEVAHGRVIAGQEG